MAATNINALLQLQVDRANLAQVNNAIEKGVGNIEVKFDGKTLAKGKSQIKDLGDQADKSSKQVKNFADRIALRGTSFAAFSVASTALIKLTGAISNATREAIKLEVELAKIAQTTNQSVSSIKANTQAVLDISKNYGVASNKVAELIRLLTQTGLSFKEATKGAETLARTSLLASFDNLRSTTEGLIAVINSFQVSTDEAAKGLEVINVLAKRFAVESGDIVEAVKRTGGAFKAAGGNLNELAALFTAVRSTSRESAETIATAFRTIFGRLQRPKTIEFFKELNIELADAKGNFIGPKNAIFAIADGLEKLGITAGSIKFAEVAEQIGGIRQLSKVIPLLTQTAKARRALAEANNAEAESDRDVLKAKQTLGQQLAELTQNFRALFAEVTQSATFKLLAQTFLTIANTAVEIGRALKPLLPLFAIFGTIKLSKGLLTIIDFVRSGGISRVQGLAAAGETGGGGGRFGFNRGGVVPGSGNSDTVPAMLTPGEFVIRKSAVQAFGAANLGRINRYADGGQVKGSSDFLNYGVDVGDLKDRRKKIPRALGASARGSLLGNMFEAWLFEKYRVKTQEQKFPDVVDAKDNGILDLLTNITNPAVQHLEFKYKKGIKANFQASRKDKAGRELNFTDENTAVVYGFNKGGAVGTDTVPALLTPGEFVVNQKSAKAYGYSNLKRINKYAKGGVVQRFQDGGLAKSSGAAGRIDPVSKQLTAEIGQLSKFIKDAAGSIELMDYEADELVQTISKLEKNSEILFQARAEGAKNAKALARIDQIRLQKEQELTKLLADRAIVENAQIQAAAQKEAKIGEARTRKQAGVGTLTEGRTGTQSADPSRPLAELKEVEESLKGVGEEAKKTESAFAKAIKNVTLWSTALQAGVATLKQFGVELSNEEAFQGGAERATILDTYGKVIGEQTTKAGNKLSEWGGKLSKQKGKLGKFGGFLSKTGPKLAKFGVGVAKATNILGGISLAAGVVEGIFTTNFKKVSEKAIELGDASAAGSAALKAYAQEQNRSGLLGLSGLGAFFNLLGKGQDQRLEELDERGQLVVKTAELRASINKLNETDQRLAKEIGLEVQNAIRTNDFAKVGELNKQRVSELTRQAESAIGVSASGRNLVTGSNFGLFESDTIAKRQQGLDSQKIANEALANVLGKTQAAFDDIQPAIQAFGANVIRSGGSLEDFYRQANDQFGLQSVTGGEIGQAGREKLAAKRDALARERDEAKAKALQNRGSRQAESDQEAAKLAQLQIDQIDQQISNNAALEAQGQAIKRQEEIIALQNAAYLESVKAIRDFNNELRSQSNRIADAEFGLEKIEFAKTGKLTPDIILDQLGLRDVATKDLQTITESGQGTDFIAAASAVGPATQEAAKKAVTLQQSLNNFLDNPEKFIPKAEELKGIDAPEKAAESFIDKLIPADAIGPDARKLLNKKVSDAIREGKFDQLESIVRDTLSQEAQGSFNAVQTELKAAAKFAAQAQSQYAEVYKGDIELAQKRFALQREAAAKVISLEEERISSLEGIGLKSRDALKLRKSLQKKELDGIKQQNALESASIKAGIDDLKKERDAITGSQPSDIGKKQALDKEIQRREGSLVDVGGRELTEEGIKAEIDARKKGIQIMVQEEQARRENTKALQEARGALLEDLAFGTDEARASLLDDANVAATAISRGSMAGFTGEQRQQTQRFLGRFTGLGGQLGEQARAVKGRLGAQELLEQGVITPAQFEQTAKDIARAEEPIDQKVSKAINDEYKKIGELEQGLINKKTAQLSVEAQIQEDFRKAVDDFADNIDKNFQLSQDTIRQQKEAVITDKVESAKKAEETETKFIEGEQKKKTELQAKKKESRLNQLLAGFDPTGTGPTVKQLLSPEGGGFDRQFLRSQGIVSDEDVAKVRGERGLASAGTDKFIKEQAELDAQIAQAEENIKKSDTRKETAATQFALGKAEKAAFDKETEEIKKQRQESEQQKVADRQARGTSPFAAAGAVPAAANAKAKKDSSEAVAEGVKKAQQQAPAAAGAAPAATGAGPVGPQLSAKQQKQQTNLSRLARSGTAEQKDYARGRLQELGLEEAKPTAPQAGIGRTPALPQEQGAPAPPEQKVTVTNEGSVQVVLAAPGLVEAIGADTDQRVMSMLSTAFASVSDKLTGAQNMDEVKSAFSSVIDVSYGDQNGETATA